MLLWICLTLLGLSLLHVGVIVADGLTDDTEEADVVVVLGNQVLVSGDPHPRLAARLDAALRCFDDGCAKAIIVSGGRGKSGYQEAWVMREYLVIRGVPEDQIIADVRGHTTRHTAQNTSELMKQHGWDRAIVATQYFHVSRTKLAMRQAGVEQVGSVHARYTEVRDVYSLGRELIGYWAYALGARSRARG